MRETKVASTRIEVESRNRKKDRPTYIYEMGKRFVRWTGIEDEEIVEGLDYLTGDLFFELRKLTSQSCTQNEDAVKRMIRQIDKVFNGDREKVKKVFEIMELEMSGLKEATKTLIDTSWRDIVDKQKVGLDKICIVITRNNTKENEKQEEGSPEAAGK